MTVISLLANGSNYGRKKYCSLEPNGQLDKIENSRPKFNVLNLLRS
jgi:hypothetical protein